MQVNVKIEGGSSEKESAGVEAGAAAAATTNTGTSDSKQASFVGEEGYKRIKTHFPSARVKKLMQSDEDIGKVAQATPVALGRALEMFMSTLVEKAVETAKEEGTHKVNVQVLNKTIENNEQFDFCVGICDKYTKQR